MVKMLVSWVFLVGLTLSSSVLAEPRIQLSTQKVDLGAVMYGEFAKGEFEITNGGDSPLDIFSIETSCGCTVVDFEPKVIAPGEKMNLKVSVDTLGKVGEIRKTATVKSNDALTPEIEVFFYVRVKLEDHKVPDMSAIFSGDCKYCHAEAGRDLKGEELFEAVCYMCHGHYGLGGISKRINDFGFISNVDDGYIRKLISEGEPKKMMPGFSKANGGPLDEGQIESLVKLIRWWEEGFIFKANEERRQ